MNDFLELIMTNPMLLITSIALVLTNIALAYLILPYIKLKKVRKIVDSGLSAMVDSIDERKALQQLYRYTSTIKIKMSPFDKLEFNYIEKSNIKKIVPFMNIYILFILSAILFVAFYQPIYQITYSPIATIILSSIFTILPFIGLDLLKRRNVEVVRRDLAIFTSILGRHCCVKEDILYAFEKSIDSGIREPLKTYIRDLTIQVKKGLDIQESLTLLSMKVDSPQFRDFVLNISQNLQSGGNIIKLLQNLEEEYFRLEKEYKHRKITTLKDRLILFGSMFGAIAIAFYFLKNNPQVMKFYLNTASGQGLLILFSLMFLAAFLISLKISNFNY